MPTFNLIDDPWLDVLIDGQPTTVSARTAFARSREIDALLVDLPTQIPAILRHVLLPILVDARGIPQDPDDWIALFEADTLLDDRLDAYLASHRDRFDLFHPTHPFAQVADLRTATGEAKPTSVLIPTLASGNNVPLFSARTEADPPTLPPAAAARWLLHAHCWDTAAIKTGAIGDPRAKGGKTTGNPTGSLGQLGVVVPLGRNLAETLVLNIPIVAGGLPPGDAPPWRREPATARWEVRPARGLLDAWTWQSRRVRLHPVGTADGPQVSRVLVSAGDRMTTVNEAWEPHTVWRSDPKPRAGTPPTRPQRHRPGTLAWQGLQGLLVVERTEMAELTAATRSGQARLRTSLLLRQIQEHDLLPGDYPLRAATFGVEYGNQSAVVEDILFDDIPMPVAALHRSGSMRRVLVELVTQAEGLARAADRFDADVRRAAGGDPLERGKGQTYGDLLLRELDIEVRTLLADLQHPDTDLEQRLAAWERTAQTIARHVIDPIKQSAPPNTFLGRTRIENGKEHTYRMALADMNFAATLRRLLPRVTQPTPTATTS